MKHWWTKWHERHPYEPAPPYYVQNNPEYRPETVITREEFNIYTQILGSMLVQFAEKKDVRAYDGATVATSEFFERVRGR